MSATGHLPAPPVLSDGHALYTPGLSESRGGVSTYAASDVLGNLWFLDGAGSGTPQTYYQDTTAFGTPTAIGSTSASPFRFGGANGCQSDADTGLVLMGHRYYDTRLGRFLSQDPAGDGDNWYAYAGNDPVDEVDPDGLMPMDGPGSSPIGSPGYDNIGETAGAATESGFENFTKYTFTHTWTQVHERVDGTPQWVDVPGSDTYSITENAFATGYNPTSQMMRAPNWLQKAIQGIAIAVALHGGHVHPAEKPVELPNVTAKEEKKGPTVEENDKGKSNFSLRNFEQNMGRLGSGTRDFLDDLAAAVKRQQNSSYAPFVFGGGAGAYVYY